MKPYFLYLGRKYGCETWINFCSIEQIIDNPLADEVEIKFSENLISYTGNQRQTILKAVKQLTKED
jgi:hypothetical protein